MCPVDSLSPICRDFILMIRLFKKKLNISEIISTFHSFKFLLPHCLHFFVVLSLISSKEIIMARVRVTALAQLILCFVPSAATLPTVYLHLVEHFKELTSHLFQ